MKRLAKYLGIAAIAIALLLTAGGWFVNSRLQSAETHADIEAKIAEALHLPVKIESLGFSVWSGISVKKITVTGPDGILFEAAGFSAGHRFAPLLRGSIALGEVRLEQPHFRLVQNAGGKWELPRTAATAQPVIAAPAPVVTVAPPATAAAPTTPAKPGKISIGKITIENATAELLDKTRAPYATIQGLSVSLRDVTESGFSGNITAARAILHGAVALDHIAALVTRTGGGFQIRKLTAETGGGGITGEGTWIEGTTGTAALQLNLINLARATQDAGMKGQKISGVLSGEAHLTGLGADPRTLAGKGRLALKGGDCSQFEFLRQIADALQLASLANFQIADASADFQVANGQAVLSPMEVTAPPAAITLNGPIAFDGALNLSAQLRLPASLVAGQQFIAGQFSPPDAAGLRSIPFAITGTMSKPRQNLAENLTGTKDRKQQRIIAAESILSTILEKKNPKLLQQLLPQKAQPVQPAPTQQ